MELNEKINNIKKDISYLESLDSSDISLIIKEANQKYYYSSEPIFDDDTYDIIVERLELLDKNNEILNEVSGGNSENKVLLPYFLGSQDKIVFAL